MAGQSLLLPPVWLCAVASVAMRLAMASRNALSASCFAVARTSMINFLTTSKALLTAPASTKQSGLT